eukprot:Ihof_evm9s3 gene=Ihof_evmTU9s3
MASMEKIKVGILGATGMVGQRFVQLLDNHPWFEIAALGASERSAGTEYNIAANWKLDTPIPAHIGTMIVSACVASSFSHCKIVFSGLDNTVAGEIETEMAQSGLAVFSNSKNHRYDQYVPLVVPTVNADHLDVIAYQQKSENLSTGFIVTNANCSSTGLCVPLKVLDDVWGLECVMVTTMQAVSGAGYPGVSSMDILGNIVPHIGGEEEKMELEPLKILGNVSSAGFHDAQFKVSAHCNRVPVIDGHTECVSVKLRTKATPEEVVKAMEGYVCEAQRLKVPSAPIKCINISER